MKEVKTEVKPSTLSEKEIKLKYDSSMKVSEFEKYCKVYLVDNLYKILCLREEKKEWKKTLESLMVDLMGANRLIGNSYYFGFVSKVEGLFSLTEFKLFRKIIFECINLAKSLPEKINSEEDLKNENEENSNGRV